MAESPETTRRSDDDIANWLRRVANQPELRTRHGAHVECQPAMLIEAAEEIERLRPLAAERQAQLDHEARMRRPPVFTDDMDGRGGGA